MSVEAGRSNAMIQAAGTLVRERAVTHPEQRRRVRLLVELGALFIAAPLLIRLAIFDWRIPLPLVLQSVLLGFIVYLLWDSTFRLASELTVGFSAATLASILGTFVIVGGAISLYVLILLPERFLGLPTQQPRLWAVIMVLYPLLSVIPQELIYRTFYFHRYGPLFRGDRWIAIVVNGLLFGFAHVLFGSYVSILLTTLLGFLVAWRYDRTRSLWAACLEHSLYGCLVFTVGLGHYFFTGVAGFR